MLVCRTNCPKFRLIFLFKAMHHIVTRWLASITRSPLKRSLSSTVFAVSTGRVRSAVAIIRISGPDSRSIVRSLTPGCAFPRPRVAERRQLRDANDADRLIDDALVLFFPKPHSYTGEDVAELHVHGSPAVLSYLCRVLSASGSCCRQAEPGEFTRRALLNGKLDLTRVEALADLIASESEAQRRQAIRQMHGGGGLSQLYERWSSGLIDAVAHLEAIIDFSDGDNDIDSSAVFAELFKRVDEVRLEIERELRGYAAARRIREGVNVAVLGRVNVGKSSLINRLARREASIVSEIGGTTRDLVSSFVDIGGLPCQLTDTAGMRFSGSGSDSQAETNFIGQNPDPIERLGIERALEKAATSDVLLLVIDARELVADRLAFDDARMMEMLCDFGVDMRAASEAVRRKLVVPIVNKSDLVASSSPLHVSCLTGAGFERVVERIGDAVRRVCSSSDGYEMALVTRQRHCDHLRDALAAIGEFENNAASGSGNEQCCDLPIAAEALRRAMEALAKLVGRGAIREEELLDRIFSEFCIGK